MELFMGGFYTQDSSWEGHSITNLQCFDLRVLFECLLGDLCPCFTSEVIWPSVLLDQYLLEVCILSMESSDYEISSP